MRIKLVITLPLCAAYRADVPLPRRQWLSTAAGGSLATALVAAPRATRAAAAAPPAPAAPPALRSDEFAVEIDAESVGLELEEIGFAPRTLGQVPSLRVVVRAVRAGGAAARADARVRDGLILVSVNGASLEGLRAAECRAAIAAAPRPRVFVFRDPAAFANALAPVDAQNRPDAAQASRASMDGASPRTKGGGRGEGAVVATEVLPRGSVAAGDDGAELSVTRVRVPNPCARGAEDGDLLEVRYEARFVGASPEGEPTLFDGSGVTFADGRAIPGRGGDDSIYFVLGKQPKGQFPPAWDPGLQGMCVSERRALRVPPVLGFGDKGVPRRGVPPGATLLYDIELLGINGDNSLR